MNRRSIFSGFVGLKERSSGISQSRRESNAWLRERCEGVVGLVLSVGSGDDSDGESGHYRDYFVGAESYTTSEVSGGDECDLCIDVRSMPQIETGTYDCIFSSGVLEHVDDFGAGMAEMTRILKPGGTLLLGLPFRQAIHMPPHDYWRFTEFGIRHLLRHSYDIIDLNPIDESVEGFPAAYWVKAMRL